MKTITTVNAKHLVDEHSFDPDFVYELAPKILVTLHGKDHAARSDLAHEH